MGRALGFRRWAALALGAAAAAISATSCGGDDDTTPEDGPATTASACARYAQAGCAFDARCVPLALELSLGTPAACEQRLQQVCETLFDVEGSNLTPDGLVACAGAFDRLSCEAIYTEELPAACDVFRGTRATNASCAADVQCQSGECDADSNEACGKCVARVGDGETCTGGQVCERGLYCGTGGVCRPFVGAGGACDPAAGLACEPLLVCVSDTCEAPLGAGEPCDPADSGCNVYQYQVCSSSDQVCAPSLTAGEGQACGSIPSSGYVLCIAGTYCAADTPDTKVCTAQVPDGGSCTDSSMCQLFAKCIGGACALEPATCP
jgi:hypothetical protein